MPRILDIDLDAFVSPICNWGTGDRLRDDEYEVWPVDRLVRFLEQSCGLRTTEPRPGAAFENHDEAFYYWRAMLESGVLTAPFEVDHIDAHSDLGIEGYNGWRYIMTELLSLPVEARRDPERSYVGPSNFPAFAIANRWISKFRFVMPQEYENDMFSFYWADPDDAYAGLQLKLYDAAGLKRVLDGLTAEPLATEPIVPLELIRLDDYSAAGSFDLVTVTRSPPFTPPKADTLFEVIKTYIRSPGT